MLLKWDTEYRSWLLDWLRFHYVFENMIELLRTSSAFMILGAKLIQLRLHVYVLAYRLKET